MTELRDARFKKALDEASDADVRPPLALAESIRAAARSAAVQPQRDTAERAPWWRRFWAGTGQPRGPLGAALATVVLGVLVTTLWIDKPVPEPRPYGAVPAPATEPAAQPAIEPATQPAAEIAAIPPRAAVGHSNKASEESEVKAVLRDTQPDETTALRSVATAADAPLAAPPVAAAAMAKRAVPGLKPDTVDITQQGRSAAADLHMAQRLYALVQNLELQAVAKDSGNGAQGDSIAPALVLLFRTQGQPVASFTLAERKARWERVGQSPVFMELTDAQAAQLLQAAQEGQAAEPAQ